MNQSAWDEIEHIYTLPQVSSATIKQFRALKSTQLSHTKKEGNPHHYCSLFLPYDKTKNKVYLCHHIKADDWIPPGGHIEPGETPLTAAIREMKEELRVAITKAQLEAWNISVKPINRAAAGCLTHYDIWHLVHISEQTFDYDPREYHAGGWFSIPSAQAKITKNPDFAYLVGLLARSQ